MAVHLTSYSNYLTSFHEPLSPPYTSYCFTSYKCHIGLKDISSNSMIDGTTSGFESRRGKKTDEPTDIFILELE